MIVRLFVRLTAAAPGVKDPRQNDKSKKVRKEGEGIRDEEERRISRWRRERGFVLRKSKSVRLRKKGDARDEQ